jgi:hypothetical protein
MRYAWFAVSVAAVAAGGCPSHGIKTRGYPEPSVQDVVTRLAKARDELTSFRADATMDYWLANQRAKGEVLVMGTTGAKVRFAALSPAGGSTMAEMACDGANFVYGDYQNNCALSGPCDQHSIAQFFRIDLAPDDFVHLALGTPPVIASPTGKVTWDGDHGYEKVELQSAEGTQRITIDARDNKWDVIDSELVSADGKVRWSVANTAFTEVAGHRVPGKTRFKSPVQNEDLLVEWGSADDRGVNIALEPAKFHLDAPAGLAMCGQQAPAAAGAPPAAPAPTVKPAP